MQGGKKCYLKNKLSNMSSETSKNQYMLQSGFAFLLAVACFGYVYMNSKNNQFPDIINETDCNTACQSDPNCCSGWDNTLNRCWKGQKTNIKNISCDIRSDEVCNSRHFFILGIILLGGFLYYLYKTMTA